MAAVPTRKPARRAISGLPVIKKPPTRAASRAAGPLSVVTRDPAELLRQWVDELGRLDSELVEIRPKLKRVEILRDLIRERFAMEPAASGFDAHGCEHFATLGPKAYQSTVDYAAVQKEMGLAAYAAIARPTLAELQKTLAPAVLARVVGYSYSGARPVKTFPLPNKIVG